MKRKLQAFTLIEMVLTLTILGLLTIGISNLVSLSGQMYATVQERERLLGEARFAMAVLTRELRQAVPASLRVRQDATSACLEFVPFVASSLYYDVPVLPEAASVSARVFRIRNYQCTATCNDSMVVYATRPSQIYDGSLGYRQPLALVPPPTTREDVDGDGNADDGYSLQFDQSVRFAADSPSRRFYVVAGPVSYCVQNGQLRRYEGYGFHVNQPLPSGNYDLLAEHLTNDLRQPGEQPFSVTDPQLQRSSVVHLYLAFHVAGDKQKAPLIFSTEVNIPNVP